MSCTHVNTQRTHLLVLPPAFTNNKFHEGHMYYLVLAKLVNRFYKQQGWCAPLIVGYDCHGIAIKLKLRSYKNENNVLELTRAKRFCLQSINAAESLYERLNIKFDAKWTTQDLHYHLLVDEFFKKAMKKGLIQHKEYVQEWCPNCEQYVANVQTGLEKVNKKEYYITFSIEGSSKTLSIMTTKPEYLQAIKLITISKDSEYLEFDGGWAVIQSLNIRVPIVVDSAVTNVGTGAMMICCFGSILDFKILKRHNISITNSVDSIKKCFLNMSFQSYEELQQIKKRKIEEYLIKGIVKQGSVVASVTVLHTDRSSCRKPIEYVSSLQTYLSVTKLKPELLLMISKIEMYPSKYEVNLRKWIEQIQDWCISRSYAWASHAPLATESQIVADMNIEKLSETYLDCWFQSAIAWLYTSKCFKDYPVDFQIQGYQILTKWGYYSLIAAVVLDYQVPFKKLRLTSLLRSKDGKKFSKSNNTTDGVNQLLDAYPLSAINLWVASLRSDADMILQTSDIQFANKVIQKYRSINNFYKTHSATTASDSVILERYAELPTLCKTLVDHFIEEALEYRLDSIKEIIKFIYQELSKKLLKEPVTKQQVWILKTCIDQLEPIFTQFLQ